MFTYMHKKGWYICHGKAYFRGRLVVFHGFGQSHALAIADAVRDYKLIYNLNQ